MRRRLRGDSDVERGATSRLGEVLHPQLDARLRDAVTRLEMFTKAVLSGENELQVPLVQQVESHGFTAVASCVGG